MRPASARALVWWLIVGCDFPSGSSRSHEHTSPPAATRLSSRRRTGSASAANSRASSVASSSAIGAAESGARHTPSSRRTSPIRLAAMTFVLHLLTEVDTFARIDRSTVVNISRGTTMSRVQLALNVPDIDKAVDFYSGLSHPQPNNPNPGYATSPTAAPPLKLVLFENAAANG